MANNLKKEENELKDLFLVCNKKFFSSSLHSFNFKFNFNSKKTCFWNGKIFEIGFIENHEDFLISFLHELIHVENSQKKIQDVGTNSYHKKTFSKKALDIGFFVIRHKARGWSILSTSYPRNVIFENFCLKPSTDANKNLVSFLSSQKFTIDPNQKKEKKSYSFKYTCKCPSHNTIRSGRDPDGNNPLFARCLICNSKFEFQNTDFA